MGIIFLAGLLLRLYRLNLNIPSLYADETAQYVSYHNVVDHLSGTINSARYSFLTATWLFGLTPLGVRFPVALYGSLFSLAAFLFAWQISRKNPCVSLICSLLIALLPWSYMISRLGHSAIPLVILFVCLHVYFFLQANNISKYLLSFMFFLLAAINYQSLLFLFPFVVLMIWINIFHLLERKYKPIYIFISVLLIASLIMFFNSFYRISNLTGRGLDLAIWRDVNTPYEIDKYRALSWNSQPTWLSFNLPPEQLANKLVYNRLMANISIFSRNYFSFFSPDWLFLKGDPILRHSTGQVGEFYPFLIPFMFYGAFAFFAKADKKTRSTFLLWILISPVPAAITKDGAGYLLRVVAMLPFLTYFCALGLVESFNLIRKPWRILYGVMVVLIALYSFYYFFYGYFHVYPSLSERSYEYGFKELSDFQVRQSNASLLVVWDGFYHNSDFRFWQNTPLDQYQSFKLNRIESGSSVFWQSFPNLFFSAPKNEIDVRDFINKYKVQYVVLPDRYFVKYPEALDHKFGDPVYIINYPDQTPVLKIFQPQK